MAGSKPAPRAGLIGWLSQTSAGMIALALLVGIGGGLGAIVFRWLIYSFTWLATGHVAFGQQGRVPSDHLPWLGIAFFVVIPVIGGILYGPLIYKFAREARGHGVPEVMLAVAENGGRIRPQVSVVKALASAMCIGVGGSVGREGPIVQIGSALASTVGQLAKMDRDRLRILVACGAGAGISATFNAPLTGVFFGFEIILRTFSIDALFPIIVSSVFADLVSRAAFGGAPFFTGLPDGLVIHRLSSYALVAVLGVLAGLIGVAFSKVLYKIEDACDRIWEPRPEWARPAVMGLGLGALLLALPQMYGVGYPVMDQAVAGRIALWLLIVLTAGKMVATGLTIGIGGSGGVFAPSLFVGAMSGTAFGTVAVHLFGPSAGDPAVYGMVAMGAVFAAAARAPLTSIASVTEMTGDFGLMLPVMLAVGISAAVSRRLSYGTIYTTKLLRRGIDIDAESKAANALHEVTVADVMRRFPEAGQDGMPALTLAPHTVPLSAANGGSGAAQPGGPAEGAERKAGREAARLPGGGVATAEPGPNWPALVGTVTASAIPEPLFANQSLDQATRLLVRHSRYGLPVLAQDGQHLSGWVSDRIALTAIAAQAELVAGPPEPQVAASGLLDRYRLLEITVAPTAAAATVGDVSWPPACVVVSLNRPGHAPRPAEPEAELRPGDRLVVLAPAQYAPSELTAG